MTADRAVVDAIVIEDLAADDARKTEAIRQLIALVADLVWDVEVWKVFGAREYHARLQAERARDRAYDRVNQMRKDRA